MINYLNSILSEFLAKPPTEKLWEAIGLCGTLMFFSRFIVQWIVSEWKKQSVIPVAFWYLSLAGSGILLAYALYVRKPVFILAYAPNSLIYIRNLWMIYRRERTGKAK